jgi:predicted NBD/HSP70 family sugar kinase
MSGMDVRVAAKTEQKMLDQRYAEARADLERSRLIENGQSGALLFAAMAYGDALEENTLFRTASHLAKLFCIAAAFVIPNLLVIYVLL